MHHYSEIILYFKYVLQLVLHASVNVYFCLDQDSLSFSYNSSDGYQHFNYIFVNIQFGVMVKTTHFISLQIELSLQTSSLKLHCFSLFPMMIK